MMKSIAAVELILLIAASWTTTAVLGQSNMIYTGWTQKFFDNSPYESQQAVVGDTITFIWLEEEVQNVFIHPTNNCTQTNRIPVGNLSPTSYTFTANDASPEGKEIFFANDIGDRCETKGMRLTVTVFPDSDDAGLEPTDSPVTMSLTAAPVVATDAPIFIAPTDAPVVATEAPVFIPATDAPVVATDAPVVATETPIFIAPTDAPVVATDAPVVAPTEAPVFIAPTDAPVVPTDAPVVAPTDAPVVPTAAPVVPTNPPTDAPISPPVTFPTFPPTPGPTAFPTNPPTSPPTTSPTPNPSAKPVAPVAGPTESPTTYPLSAETKKTMRGLIMTVDGIDSFSGSTVGDWEDTTEDFSTAHYEKDFPRSTFRTTISVTNSQEISQRRGMRGRRGLQGSSGYVITYNQVVSYISTAEGITDEYLAKSAFATSAQRDQYVQSLQNSGNSVLGSVTDTTAPTFANDNVPTSAPINSPTQAPINPDNKDSVLSMAVIIGIACAGGALLIIIILAVIYCNKKGSKENPTIESNNPPTRSISLKDDEVSTLAGPSITGGALGAMGDRSVGTVDYDYSKAYGNGDTSVSSAGGTFGSNTQNISLPANAGATGAALGPYNDDGSYQEHFHGPGNNVKEEILHIFAPPGKLGVVIDTPDDGAPVVHAVKDSSVVVDKVQVGDKLVAVDDEDVRTLTAIKVSKLISRKSANPSRKLTILRTTLIE